MSDDLKKFVRSCHPCQANKPVNALPLGSPEVRAVPSRPGEAIAVDVVAMPPTGSGFNAIVTWIDLFSNYIVASPAVLSPASPLTAEALARLFIQDVVALRGFPAQITSDSRFQSDFWGAVRKAIRANGRFTTAYHPQSDPAERAHRMILEAFKCAVGTDYDKWDEYLPLVQLALNNPACPHSS